MNWPPPTSTPTDARCSRDPRLVQYGMHKVYFEILLGPDSKIVAIFFECQYENGDNDRFIMTLPGMDFGEMGKTAVIHELEKEIDVFLMFVNCVQARECTEIYTDFPNINFEVLGKKCKKYKITLDIGRICSEHGVKLSWPDKYRPNQQPANVQPLDITISSPV